MDQTAARTLDWLLEPADPGVRYLALRDLLHRPWDDPELAAARALAHQDGPIAAVLDAMRPEGYWEKSGPGYTPKYFSTVWALILLAQLGARLELDERIARACRYALDHALTPLGQFSAGATAASTADCLQGNLCRALTVLGMEDPRLDLAYDTMARSVTGDGFAPKGEKSAGLRYTAGKCGPNFACGSNLNLPCAWGAVKVMSAFAALPPAKHTLRIEDAIQQGIDFLFSVDPAGADYPAAYTGKPSQSWWKFGFPVFYVTDVLQIVEALTELGLGEDPRLVNARALVRSKQGADGRWPLEYDYRGKTCGEYGVKKQPNKWVTLRALRALRALCVERAPG